MENQENQDYVSLYDFLGKAAGEDLGKEVYSASVYSNVLPLKREVQNTKFAGTVNLYPKLFLKGYFAGKKSPQQNPQSVEYIKIQPEDDLPF